MARGGCGVHEDIIKRHYSKGKKTEISEEKHLCKKITDQI